MVNYIAASNAEILCSLLRLFAAIIFLAGRKLLESSEQTEQSNYNNNRGFYRVGFRTHFLHRAPHSG